MLGSLRDFHLIYQLLRYFQRCVAFHFSLSGKEETVLKDVRSNEFDVFRRHKVTSGEHGVCLRSIEHRNSSTWTGSEIDCL